MSRVLIFLFIFSLSALVGSINGRPACGSTPTSEDTYNQQMESYEESQRQIGRIGLECEPYTSGSGSNSSSSPVYTILGFFIIFSIVGVPIGICIACIQRQKAINAASLNKISGQVGGGAQVGHGSDVLKSYPETNTVQKGDPGYKV